METAAAIKESVDAKLSKAELLEIIAAQQQTIADLQKRIEQLEGKNPTERLGEAFSERAEEKRRKKKRGRRPRPSNSDRVSTAEKIALAQRTEQVYPADSDPESCQLSHTRVAWRLEEGKAVLVAYEIYRCGKNYGKPAGLIGRGEFGLEILISLAYQVYCIGISLDKACELMQFFQGLKLSKSQADMPCC